MLTFQQFFESTILKEVLRKTLFYSLTLELRTQKKQCPPVSLKTVYLEWEKLRYSTLLDSNPAFALLHTNSTEVGSIFRNRTQVFRKLFLSFKRSSMNQSDKYSIPALQYKLQLKRIYCGSGLTKYCRSQSGSYLSSAMYHKIIVVKSFGLDQIFSLLYRTRAHQHNYLYITTSSPHYGFMS